MRKKVMKGLYFLSLLSSVFFTPTVEAKMPVTAFKGITKVFKKGKEYMSPTLGMAALETGLIHDLRFYYKFDASFREDGTNEYMNDTSNDPLWSLLKDLMPSPAGSISPTVSNLYNFGRVATPETVAALLNYTNAYRDYLTRKQTIDEQNDQSLKSQLNRLNGEKYILPIMLKQGRKEVLSEKEGKASKKWEKTSKRQALKYDNQDSYDQEIDRLEQEIALINVQKDQIHSQNVAQEESLRTHVLSSLDASSVSRLLQEKHLEELIDKGLSQDKNYLNLKQQFQQAKEQNNLEQLQALKDQLLARRDQYLSDQRQSNPEWGILKGQALEEEQKKWMASFKNETLDKMIKEINGALDKEGSSMAPKHTVEQVIESFFCEKFNTRADMHRMLSALDDDIVDKDEVSKFRVDDNLSEQDLPNILRKQEDTLDADDIYALSNASVFTAITPYKPGASPVSNDRAHKYDRKTNTLLNETIAECVEMSWRHFCNLILYNPESKSFDLSHLKKNPTDERYFKNFEDFFALQTPDKANSGDLSIRSAANKVVADLNAYQDPIKINYMQGTNELNAGFINFINVFRKLFSLDLVDAPEQSFFETDDEFHQAQLDWVSEGMKIICNNMNPNYVYDFSISNQQFGCNELSGYMLVKAFKKEGEEEGQEAFSFQVGSHVNIHANVSGIKTPTEDVSDSRIKSLLLQYGKRNLGDTFETLSLLMRQAGVEGGLHSPLYRLFKQNLQDNESRINLLNEIVTNYSNWKQNPIFKGHLEEISFLVDHILEQTSWSDIFIARKVTDILFSPDLKDEDLLKNISRKVKSLFFGSTNIGSLDLRMYNHLETLTLDSVSVERLDMPISPFLRMFAMGDVTNLEKLSLEKADNLEILILRNSMIQELELPSLPSLKSLAMSSHSQMQKLSLEKADKLEAIELQKLGIQELELPSLPSLKTLKLSSHSQMQKLSIESADQLEEMDLSDLGIQELELPNLPSLKALELSSQSQLRKLSLNKADKLEVIGLKNLGIQELELPELPSLRRLDLFNNKDLHRLSLNKADKLEFLDLDNSGITQIDLQNSPMLKILNLETSDKLETLSLKTCAALDVLSLPTTLKKAVLEELGSIKSLEALQHEAFEQLFLTNMDGLQVLDLSGARNMKKLTLKGSFEKLEVIRLPQSSNIEIDGLKELIESKKMRSNKLQITGLIDEKLHSTTRPGRMSEDDPSSKQ